MRILSALLLLTVAAAAADPPVYAVKVEPKAKLTFLQRLERDVPPLKNPRGQRWPLICWECVGFDPQPAEAYQALLARGLTQHIQLDEKMLPTAQALQKAGCPVIMMQGAGGPWPAQLAGDAKQWAHQFEAGYTPKAGQHVRPCLAVYDGWAVNADRIRALLRKYRDAGVTVNAVWMDWEGDPYFFNQQFEQASHCTRCRAQLPPHVLASAANCYAYAGRLYYRLLDTYLAAPVAEVFPQCSTTNWMVVCSTPERPALPWWSRPLPAAIPGLLTATNPVAYGNTTFWEEWKKEWPLDREHVDQFYTHLMLRQVSDDTANRLVYAPEKQSIPWVCRWCPDNEDPKIPILSRERYRELLRHLWLRGADAMQIFNPSRPGFEDIVFSEVQDAVAIYDEMLGQVRFLNDGEVMNLEVPPVQHDGVLWSGRRLGEEALVRVFKQNGGAARLDLTPWPERKVTIDVTDQGTTYLLKREGEAVTVKAL